MKTAFIGIGIMGVRQAANVAAGGFPLTAYSRSPEKADPLVAKGARRAASIADACRALEAWDLKVNLDSRGAHIFRLFAEKGGLVFKVPFDPADPVKYDFSVCHLGMMNACGFETPRGDSQCPLKGVCRPKPRRKSR